MADTVIGLRVDVDTLRGTRDGVPELIRVLGRHGVQGSFFFSVGPDNMGRHLWRLLKPAFLVKMLRTRAASLYGWDILLRGTLWPGPVIGRRAGGAIRMCAAAGHEIGFHAWDHHRWQAQVATMSEAEIRTVFELGLAMLRSLGSPATASASPAWRSMDSVLEVAASMSDLRYGSDCRGEGLFLSQTADRVLERPQVPVNLPTYDEVVGRNGVVHDDWNDLLERKIQPGGYNVLTIHAEVEGGMASPQLDDFLNRCAFRGWRLCPLAELIPDDVSSLPTARIEPGEIPGREGWISLRV